MPGLEPALATDQDSLSALLADVGRGDRAAFERLYRTTSSKLFGVCLRILPQRSDAEDVLQEVFATLWHKADQYDASRAAPMTWMAMLARNKSIDRLRSGASRRTESIDLAAEFSDTGPNALAVAEQADDRRRLDLCLGEIEAQRRQLVRVAFFEGVTYEELAARSGTPIGTVKSWIRRSLLKLKACLER